MKKSILIISMVLIFSIVLSGCNYPGNATPTTAVDQLDTAAAQTVQAYRTSIIQTDQPAITENPPTATIDTSGGQPTITATLEPTRTPTHTLTPTPQVECDQASFVAETIPDGTDFSPAQTFTKTWTLKNSGSCTWNANYDVVFVNGEAMGATAAKALTSGSVEPGESVQIEMELKAPIAAGTHRGDFKLRNASGVLFGIGSKDGPFWVEIDVIGTLYNFAEKVCASNVSWKSSAGALPCPGSSGDTDGWVRKIDNPILENGYTDDEPGIQVHPEMVTDGWIRGIFPKIAVTEGVYFKAIIGCYSSTECDVRFKLNYIVEGESEKTLATWHEIQDGDFDRVEVDLSSLGGKNVQFILLVEANGSPENDTALWFAPRIEP